MWPNDFETPSSTTFAYEMKFFEFDKTPVAENVNRESHVPNIQNFDIYAMKKISWSLDFGHVVFELCERADIRDRHGQTDIQTRWSQYFAPLRQGRC